MVGADLNALATNRSEVGEFFRAANSNGAVDESPLMHGWRRELLGEPLLQLLHGKRDVHLRWNDGTLRLGE